jgi:hypothetical protein
MQNLHTIWIYWPLMSFTAFRKQLKSNSLFLGFSKTHSTFQTRNNRMISSPNLIAPLNFRLWRNAQLPAKRSRGFHPRRCGSPKCDKPRTGTISSSLLTAGMGWRDRHSTLLHRTNAWYFISCKRISQEPNSLIVRVLLLHDLHVCWNGPEGKDSPAPRFIAPLLR